MFKLLVLRLNRNHISNNISFVSNFAGYILIKFFLFITIIFGYIQVALKSIFAQFDETISAKNQFDNNKIDQGYLVIIDNLGREWFIREN